MKKLALSLVTLVAMLGQANAQVKKAQPKTPVKATTSKPVMKNLLDSFSYAAGINIANNMKEQGINNLNSALMVQAIEDVFKNRAAALNPEQCNSSLQGQMAIFNKFKDEENKKTITAEKVKGEAFLAANKVRKEVTTLPDGLQYEIMEAGEAGGMKPTAQDTVVVDYIGTLINGTKFDESIGKGPATFPVGGVIEGWTKILQLMPKGAHWKVYIPSNLAYGDRGAGGAIPGGSTLIFEIMLRDIKPAITK